MLPSAPKVIERDHAVPDRGVKAGQHGIDHDPVLVDLGLRNLAYAIADGQVGAGWVLGEAIALAITGGLKRQER